MDCLIELLITSLLRSVIELPEKAKIEKKKPAAVSANKRTQASNGGPMPLAKAVHSTNAYVSSYPALPTFVRYPSRSQYPAGASPYQSVSDSFETDNVSDVKGIHLIMFQISFKR
ncbi:hypothetical protein Q3G72_003200 [Acer saccharum]|nr:hypothetical protein Q3G72_003200 [Acer saccharum]